MNKHQSVPGKILYAVVFLLIVPSLQYWWAVSAKDFVTWPAIHAEQWGIMIGVTGFLFMLYSMFILMKLGKGLPMNAYPPEVFVSKGPYALVPHPIYVGYVITMAGVAVFSGSASALWLVTPVSILAIMALVLGFEAPDLAKRFPDTENSAFLKIPSASGGVITGKEKWASLLLTLVGFACANYVIYFLAGNIAPLFPQHWTAAVLPETGILQYLALPFIFLAPFILKDRRQLRHWTISMLIALSLSIYISLLLPSVGAQYFHPAVNQYGIIAVLLTTPIFLILIAAVAYLRHFHRSKILVISLALILSFFTLPNSRSLVAVLFVAAFIFLLADYYGRIWAWSRNFAERMANSWQEWMIGPVRIINRGFYVGLGTFLGVLLAGLFVGKAYAWAMLIFGCICLVCAALWAQIIEGSEKLKRPFGYYGSVVGVVFASIAMWAMGFNVWVLIGLFAVAMPWLQAAGRVGCLVNGCCHGCKTSNSHIGIRYFHPRTRVCGLSHMKGELLHPTQLYSIIWLVFVGFIIMAFWLNHFSYAFIFGIYLMLTGLGRFVEEAYRGEVQTPVIKGLRLYQWAAICTFLIGIFMTTIHINVVQVHPDAGWQTWLAAFLGGLFTFFAMGVDFPYSNYRFSRLV